MTERQNHAERGHAQWSASATARNVTCAGAIALQTLAGEEVESEHAARGTACHEVSEDCLRNGTDPSAWLGRIVKTKQREIEIDEEIVEGANEYVDYVREKIHGKTAVLWVEEHFSLAALEPPLDAGGTCDAVLHFPAERRLEVADLKFGRGVVDVAGNPQLRTYAVGAMLAFPDLEVDTITVTVVQPRAPVKGETVRSETFYVADLIDWTHDLVEAMKRSRQALDEFEAINGSRTLFDEWAVAWLKPGACKFCRAEGYCPALRKQALSVVPQAIQDWFEDPNAVERPAVRNQVELLSKDERGHILDGLEMLDDWIKGVRAAEHTAAERGDAATGWFLADKIGNRAWVEKDEVKLQTALAKLGLNTDQRFTRKVVSPAQAEKIVGAKRKAEVDALCEKPIKGTNLVSSTKTTRAPAKTTAEKFMEKAD